MERNIQKQAARVAYKARRPDLAEDLEQEARIRTWQEAEAGETNPRYLLASSGQAISAVMRAGTDVDGKLWSAYEREHVWEVLSTDYPMDEKGTTFGEIILDEQGGVEEQVIGVIILDEISRQLTDEERLILEQRLRGYYQREIAENLQLRDRYAVQRRMRRIRERANRCLK